MTEAGPAPEGFDDGEGPPGAGDPPTRVGSVDARSSAAVEAPPQTGDPAVDAALARLHARAASGDIDGQMQAGEEVARVLRERLADLGGD